MSATTQAPPEPTASAPRWRAVLQTPEVGLVVGIVAVLALIWLLDRGGNFFYADNLQTLIHNVALYGVMALGATVVIISGGIDLSVGAVAALASVVSGKLVAEWLPAALKLESAAALPLWAALLAVGVTLLMGLLIGLLHAFLINRVGLPPFIATLATMAGLRSLAQVIAQDRTISVRAESFRALGTNPWITVSIFAGLAVFVGVMMGWTVLGRHLYAMGGNEAAARLSGLNTRRLKAVAYGLAGMLSALGGLLFTARLGLGNSGLGVAYELFAITAAVVGGCSLSGGVGSVLGAVLGLLLIRIIIMGTGLVVRNVDTTILGVPVKFDLNATQIEGLVLGTVIVLAVAFNQQFRKGRRS
jgi:ribose/xylose/arabinose/galactoside ABC-type transport system permease subunit